MPKHFNIPYQILIIGIVLFFISCNQSHPNIIPAFYFWKSSANELSTTEISTLKKHHTKILYIKFFDVVYDKNKGTIPISKTNLTNINNSLSDSTTIIPVVYIKNEVLKNKTHGYLDSLADHIIFLVEKYKQTKLNNAVYLKEYQIDCDWTESTQNNYFHLLKKIKEIAQKQISCTLRMYPYKFPNKMGTPPVDRATLMCYNLLSPIKSGHRNSIFDLNEFNKYISNAPQHPFPIDIALPIYAWSFLYKNNQINNIIPENCALYHNIFKPLKNSTGHYAVKDTMIGNIFIRKGDIIKTETVHLHALYKAIVSLKDKIKNQKECRVSLYHLDDQQLRIYKNEKLENIYHHFK